MRILYCWRCGQELPMLDEEEFASVEALYDKAVRTLKQELRWVPPEERDHFIVQQYQPVIDAYRGLTGYTDPINPHYLMHHRISIYGPLCEQCGKPLRTPKATYCAACGGTRNSSLT